jgi:heat shock protein HtpX
MYELLERTRWATRFLVAAFVLSLVAGPILVVLAFEWPPETSLALLAVLAILATAAFLVGNPGVLTRLRPKTGESPLRVKAGSVLSEAAICMGVSPPPLIILDSVSMNAGASGDEPGTRVIITTTATIESLDRAALRAVFAHELAHFRDGDTTWYPLMTTMVRIGHLGSLLGAWALVGMLVLPGQMLVALAAASLAVPGLVLLLGAAPLLARLVQVAFLRIREYDADATAALALRDPAALARALVAMDERLNAVSGAGYATSHMFAMPPEGLLAESVLAVHPPVASRLERLRMANPSSEELNTIVGDYLEQRAVGCADRQESKLLDD